MDVRWTSVYRRPKRSVDHSDIGVTLNTYTHVGYEDAQKEMKRVHEKQRLVNWQE